MMHYLVQPRDIIFEKGYRFLSFAKNMDKNINKNLSRNLSNKFSQKLLDLAEQSVTGVLKTTSKKAIQKTTEATGDFIRNKIPNKIAITLKKTTTNYFRDS